MNIADFGQTIKDKYPQYADLSNEELGSKMLAKYPQYADMVDQGKLESGMMNAKLSDYAQGANPVLGAISKAIPSIGNIQPGKVPVLGTALQGIIHPTAKALETTAEGANAGLDLTGNIPNIVTGKPVAPYKASFISPAEKQQIDNGFGSATTEGLRTGAGASAPFLPQLTHISGGNPILSALGNLSTTGAVRYGMLGSDIGPKFDPMTTGLSAGAGAIIEPLMALMGSGMMTQKGASEKFRGAVSDSQGSKNIDDVIDDIKNNVYGEDSGGVSSEIKRKTSQVISRIMPSEGSLGNESLSAQRLLDMRDNAYKLYQPYNGESTIEKEIAKKAIYAINQNLAAAAPEAVLPNAVSSLYHNPLFAGAGAFKTPSSLAGIPTALGATAIGTLGPLELVKLIMTHRW